MSAVCLHFWLMSVLKLRPSVNVLSSHSSAHRWDIKVSHTSSKSVQNCLIVNKRRRKSHWWDLRNWMEIAWKIAKFPEKFNIWLLEGLVVKNNAKNELSAQKYPSLDTNINGVEMKEKMSRTCKTSSTSPWWRPPPWVLLWEWSLCGKSRSYWSTLGKNAVSTLILVKKCEKSIKIAWKMAKFPEKFNIWPLEGLAVKNNARNGFSAQKYPSLHPYIHRVKIKKISSAVCLHFEFISEKWDLSF